MKVQITYYMRSGRQWTDQPIEVVPPGTVDGRVIAKPTMRGIADRTRTALAVDQREGRFVTIYASTGEPILLASAEIEAVELTEVYDQPDPATTPVVGASQCRCSVNAGASNALHLWRPDRGCPSDRPV